MKKILTYGTFDLFHYGHLNLLKKAKELGEYLIVGVSTDEFNTLKSKKSYHSYKERIQIVESIKFVDKVIPEISWDQKEKDIIDNKIDIFVIGDDWRGKFDYLKEYCEVVYLERTPEISTTKIKSDLNNS